MLLFIIAGLTTGSVYSLAGVGLVLTYKTSGVFNFAHGALATVSAYLFYTLHVQHGMPWPLAAVISVFVVGAVCGLLLELVARRLNGTTRPHARPWQQRRALPGKSRFDGEYSPFGGNDRRIT